MVAEILLKGYPLQKSWCVMCCQLLYIFYCLWCFDAVGWVAGRASGL